MSTSDFSFASDIKLPPSATPSPEKVENESLECDPLSLELEVSELAQKLEDIAERQAVILHNYQLMQNTQKSVLSTQNEILIRLSRLERLVQCTPQQQFQQELYPQLSWGYTGNYSTYGSICYPLTSSPLSILLASN